MGLEGREGGSRDEDVIADVKPEKLVEWIVSPDRRVQGWPHVQSNASCKTPYYPVQSEHCVAVDSDEAVRVLRLKMRLRCVADIDAVALEIDGKVING